MLQDFRLVQPDGSFDLDPGFGEITDPTEVAVTFILKRWMEKAPRTGDSNRDLLRFLNSTPESELMAVAQTASHVRAVALEVEAGEASGVATRVLMQIELDDGTVAHALLVLESRTGRVKNPDKGFKLEGEK